jgi:hypothetical protein
MNREIFYKYKLNDLQYEIILLHRKFKEMIKRSHPLADEEELKTKIIELRKSLIKQLWA